MKIDRMLSIIMLLLKRKSISAPELAKIHNVSVRTIYRDVESIGIAGIPVISTTGTKGGISLMDDFKSARQSLFSSDMESLIVNLSKAYPALSREHNLDAVKGKMNEYEKQQNKLIKVTVVFQEMNKDEIISSFKIDPVIPLGEGFYQADIYVSNDENGLSVLLFFSDKFECISPDIIREYIKAKIQDISDTYQTGKKRSAAK